MVKVEIVRIVYQKIWQILYQQMLQVLLINSDEKNVIYNIIIDFYVLETVLLVIILNEKFDLPDGSNSIAESQDNFEFIIKKHKTLT